MNFPRFTRSTAFTSAVFFLFSSCASVPEFIPSEPLDSVVTLRVGLFICSEYRAPHNAKRITALKPYLNCMTELAENFDGFHGNTMVRVFYEELQTRYELLNDAFWTPALGVEYEEAIHATLRNLWRQGGIPAEFSNRERSAMLEIFPKTSWMLDVSNKKAVQPWKPHREIESLLVQFLSLKPPRQTESTPSLIDCEDTQRLADQILRVHRYQSDLQVARTFAAHTKEEAEIEKRYNQEVRESWNLLASLRNRKIELSRCNFTLNLHR